MRVFVEKRSQMEVLGLMLIVLLLIVGMFLLVFFGKPKKVSFTTEYNEKLVKSYLAVMPETRERCGSGFVRMSDFLRACALGGEIGCIGNHDQTCDRLVMMVNTTLKNSLDRWGYTYRLRIDAVSMNLSNGNCSGRRVAGEQAVPMTTSGPPALIGLELC